MFINIEKGKLKLYDLRIYKGIEKVKQRLIYESPRDHKRIETTGLGFSNGHIIDKKDMVQNIIFQNTGRRIEYNDFYSESEAIYQYDYDIYHLTDIYLIIVALQNEGYQKLEKLNQYLKGNIKNKDQQLFEKYKDKIMRNIKLIEIMEKDSSDLELFYQMLLSHSKGEYKQKVKQLDTYLNVNRLRIESIPVTKKDIL